jgi:hypothetical protein
MMEHFFNYKQKNSKNYFAFYPSNFGHNYYPNITNTKDTYKYKYISLYIINISLNIKSILCDSHSCENLSYRKKGKMFTKLLCAD